LLKLISLSLLYKERAEMRKTNKELYILFINHPPIPKEEYCAFKNQKSFSTIKKL
jgi:hypothetical protein